MRKKNNNSNKIVCFFICYLGIKYMSFGICLYDVYVLFFVYVLLKNLIVKL